jgi:hypothetical protein
MKNFENKLKNRREMILHTEEHLIHGKIDLMIEDWQQMTVI